MLAEVDRGRGVFEATPDSGEFNPMGAGHSSATILRDSACGLAVQSALAANRGHTTLELKMSFLKPLTDLSGMVRAAGCIITVGRHLGFSEGTPHDIAGHWRATATSTLMVFDVPPADQRDGKV